MGLIIIPLFGALLISFVKGQSVRLIALLFTIIQLLVNGWMLLDFIPDGNFYHTLDYAWLPQLGIHFKIGYDGISMLMAILTNILMPVIVLSTFGKSQSRQLYALILLMQGALIGVFTALDGLLFYVFWELALIPIYFICALWGGENKIRVTLKFFIYTFIGSLFMLLSLIYMYLQTPDNHSFALSDLYNVQLTAKQALLVGSGLFLAFAVKMPVFPFHTWQPDTYTVSPTVGTMLLSGIMLKMGVYGAIRWLIPMVPEAIEYKDYIIILAVMGIVYAAIIAIRQKDMKRLFAYSSISHVGLIAAGVFVFSLESLQGSLMQMLSHGINIVGLFYVAQIIEERTGTRDLTLLGGIAQKSPALAFYFMIILLGSVALPLTNGFVGEFLLLKGVFSYNWIYGAISGLTIILCAVYMFRAYQMSMLGELSNSTMKFKDLNSLEVWILAYLAALVILLGVMPQVVFDLTNGSVNKLISIVAQM
ncbi:MAG: NADH-quinone oxidoreductase subunit M [Saprospiraceae bacterium]|nr:NADH-quinone oxidoreductase subunit M [Saprospiraceae bacterium]